MTDSPVDRRTLPPFVRRFLETEASGGIALAGAAVMALVWANSPWEDTYASFWHTQVDLRVGSFGFSGDLHHFVNDGLMTVFFLVIGLEIKRELVTGDLRDRRAAALPAVAAIGGMVVPAGLFFLFNAGGDGAAGWGIPMATDIAFALGVLSLLGSRVAPTLKLFLLSLAVVDDIGAIAVIAVFYSDDLAFDALMIALACIAAAVLAQRWNLRWMPLYVALGTACWLALFESGVHATIAGVVFGLLAPARPHAPTEVARRWTLDMSDEPSAAELRTLTTIATETVSPAERIEHLLHPLSSFVIVPIFALANAGVPINIDALSGPGPSSVALGVAVGLVVGKLVGISAATWLAVRLGVSSLPAGATWRAIVGIAALAGIGFTVSLFVTELAFDDARLVDAAKLAVLGASVVAAALGALLLIGVRRRPDGPAAGGTFT